MATTTAPVTTCPECGASIPKAGMSLCPYCASPLKTSPGADQERSPILKRLIKMEEKPEFAEAKELTPPWTPGYDKARNQRNQGRILVFVGMLVTALEFLVGDSEPMSFLFLAGVTLCVLGLAMTTRGMMTCARLDGLKVLKRSGYIVLRRSETSPNGDVLYFFLLVFGDGSEGEFSYPGRGVAHDLYSNGMTGVAFTRGEELLHIERVRA